jgi:hypothetical protein
MGTEILAACQKAGTEPDTNEADVTISAISA